MNILKRAGLVILSLVMVASAFTACEKKPGEMRDITTEELVKDMGFGWNLGNSLDGMPEETSWGNPLATQELFDKLKADGVKSVRIPITWSDHIGPGPDYKISDERMDRVQEVVDYAYNIGLYVIINIHHDGSDMSNAWLRKASTDYEGTLAKFKAVWTQAGERFKDYSDRLIFEDINELGFPDIEQNGAPTQESFDILNDLNSEFVSLIRSQGGNNEKRFLLVAGYFTDITKSAKGIVMPDDDRTFLSLHYYTPWRFCINGQNEDNTTAFWGSDADIQELERLFELLKTSFIDNGTPVILGEYGVNTKADPASRVYWLEAVTKICADMGIAPFFWDNGEEFDRKTNEWRTEGLVERFVRAASGEDYTVTKPE